MRFRRFLSALFVAAGALPLLSQGVGTLEFEPRVGAIGARVTVHYPAPPGVTVRFGDRVVTYVREDAGHLAFLVPSNVSSSFIEIRSGDKVLARSAVPFVVSGASIVPQKLIGLKEAIDVFAFQDDPIPEGGRRPETPVRPILKLGDSDVLTVGEPAPQRMPLPAVQMGDSASAATQGMGSAAFLITARPPVKRVALPTPTPTPTPAPPEKP